MTIHLRSSWLRYIINTCSIAFWIFWNLDLWLWVKWTSMQWQVLMDSEKRREMVQSHIRGLVRSSESGIPSSWNCEDWHRVQAVWHGATENNTERIWVQTSVPSCHHHHHVLVVSWPRSLWDNHLWSALKLWFITQNETLVVQRCGTIVTIPMRLSSLDSSERNVLRGEHTTLN